MLLRACCFLFLSAGTALAGVPEGVPRELARLRAQYVSNLRYHVSVVLVPHSSRALGSEEIRFSLKAAVPVLLDYRDGAVESSQVNGAAVALAIENGHLELPADKLRAGENTVTLQFSSAIAPAGNPITRYEDRDDGSEYIYTLFVPMDASMAFPCFDQPDLKGRFRLEVTAPEAWTVISNTAVESTAPVDRSQLRTTFGETRPISTYLFAFAAGPFRKIERSGLPSLYVRQSKLSRAQTEALEVQQIAQQGIDYLSGYFAQPFPFPKYDMVLIPGLAYGGMEHAGATFLREESVLFRTVPTHSDLLNRDIVVLHELIHQWFGDLTTMRWFDDLWLKEGFAQYMAYETLDLLKPTDHLWKRFYESIKQAGLPDPHRWTAYGIDVTKGTTPIYQDIPNLKDAKSAYGAIVYSKAPAVLKQLAYVLGPEAFREGLRLYLKEHLYGNAEWSELVHSFERVSGRHLDRWAEMWIRHRGMPQVDVSWTCAGGRVNSFFLTQHNVLAEDGTWPFATQVLLSYRAGKDLRFRVEFSAATAQVPATIGKPCPQYVFANDQDYAYGRFVLDPHSRPTVTNVVGSIPDVFQRTLLWGSLWESVRMADLAPEEYIELSERFLPAQTDESLAQSIIVRTTHALHHYVNVATREKFVPGFESIAANDMLHSSDPDLRIMWFRALRAIAESPNGRSNLMSLLDGKLAVPGVELRELDRWNIITALLALNDPNADAVFRAEQQRGHSGDGLKYAYIAEAARPNSSNKKNYFDDYLYDPARPEDWVEESLTAFNYWNQSQLTEPYLMPALEALPQIKRERKIFFLMSWLDAFIGGQQSPSADSEVHRFLDTVQLDPDVRLKVLQVVDELDRSARIRQKFPD